MKLTMRTAWGHGAHRALLVADAGVLRTLFTLSAKPHPLTSHTLPLHHPISPPHSKPIALLFTPVLRRDSQFSTTAPAGYGVLRTGRSPNFGLAKCISSVSSSAHTVEWNDAISSSEAWDGGVSKAEELDLEKEDEDDAAVVSAALPSIPVRAFFFSTSVDLRSLVDQNKQNFIPPTSRMTNYVVLRFGYTKPDPNVLGSGLSGSDCCYMVVFQYGSIVLFNVRDHEVDGYLKIVEKHSSGLLPEMRKDEYEVREEPTLSTWMQGGLDYIMLQYLNNDGIRTIGSVLGQSIALDYYVRQVDGMVAEFTDINRGMEKTGTFTMERKKLFQLVGKANSNLADVILKLGLFERSDIAWKDAKYAQIWEYLRDEFELTQRFASLDFKLKFVEHNIRFLQEILQNRKSDFLEWLIIILIGAEILISVYDIAHKSL
nr:sporulation protein RMD1 [Ipomoea batatas]